MTACPIPNMTIGAVRGVLYSVDCNVQSFSKAGYLALTGPGSFFSTAITSLLVIYVALLGLRMLLGVASPRLSEIGIIALKLGFVLALAFNWTVFQTLVFDLTSKGPIEVARTISQSMAGSQSSLASDPINGIQLAYDELGQNVAPTDADGASATATDPAAPPGDGLARARDTFLYSAVGVPAVAMIAIGILTTVGPLFIALSLIGETAGLFIGWVRATLSFSILSMLAWIANLFTLTALEPWLYLLRKNRAMGTPNADATRIIGMVIDISAAAEFMLVIAAIIIACGLRIRRKASAAQTLPEPARPTPAPVMMLSRAGQLALSLQPQAASRSGSRGIEIATARTTRITDVAARREDRSAPPGTRPQGSGGYRRSSVFDRIRTDEGRN